MNPELFENWAARFLSIQRRLRRCKVEFGLLDLTIEEAHDADVTMNAIVRARPSRRIKICCCPTDTFDHQERAYFHLKALVDSIHEFRSRDVISELHIYGNVILPKDDESGLKASIEALQSLSNLSVLEIPPDYSDFWWQGDLGIEPDSPLLPLPIPSPGVPKTGSLVNGVFRHHSRDTTDDDDDDNQT